MRKAFLLFLVPVIGAAFYLRSLASWRPKKVFAVQGRVSRLVFSGDGKTLLVCYAPPPSGFYLRSPSPTLPATRIVALDVRNGFKPLWEHNYAPFVQAPQFFKSDSQILLQGESSTSAHAADIQILDARSGQTRVTYKNLSGSATMSPDGRWLAFHPRFNWLDRQAGDNTVYLNPTGTLSGRVATAEKVLGDSHWSSSQALSFSPDGQTLVVGADDANGPRLDFYDTSTWKLIRTGRDTKRAGRGEDPTYQTLQWSHDGQTVFASQSPVSGENTLQSWRARDGKKLASSPLSAFYRATLPSFSFEDDGHVLSFDGDGEVRRSKGPLPYTGFSSLLRLPNEAIYIAAISPDGSTLVAGTSVGNVYSRRVR